MNIFQRTAGHFLTITRHRHQVIRHCFHCGILRQGLTHDLSKYSPAEFLPGVRYYTGTRSPNEGERDKVGYSEAWMHHKGRNKHHFEYWTDYNPETHRTEPVQMPYRYLAEMFCDRVAASKIYNGKQYTDEDPLKYFNRRRAERHMHPETERQIEELLEMLAREGEKPAFRYVKCQVKRHRRRRGVR